MKIHRLSDKNDFNIGTYHKSNKCGFYKVIDIDKSFRIIKFIKTGYITRSSLSHLKNGVIHDPTYPNVCGHGYIGKEYNEILKVYDYKFIRRVYNVWRNMLSRCYYESSNNDYHLYGKLGITVSNDWFNFSRFFIDIQNLDGWDYDKFIDKKITLDKDKKQKNIEKSKKVYSKDTCCWLSIKEQNSLIDFEKAHEHEMHNFIIIHPNGTEEYIKGLRRMCRKYNFCPQIISNYIKNNKKYKDYIIKKID